MADAVTGAPPKADSGGKKGDNFVIKWLEPYSFDKNKARGAIKEFKLIPEAAEYILGKDNPLAKGIGAVGGVLEDAATVVAIDGAEAVGKTGLKATELAIKLAKKPLDLYIGAARAVHAWRHLAPKYNNLAELDRVKFYGVLVDFKKLLDPAEFPFEKKLQDDVINSKKTLEDKLKAVKEVSLQMALQSVASGRPNVNFNDKAIISQVHKVAAVIFELLAKACQVGTSGVSLADQDLYQAQIVRSAIKIGVNALLSNEAKGTVLDTKPDEITLRLSNVKKELLFAGGNNAMGHNQVPGGPDDFVSWLKDIGDINYKINLANDRGKIGLDAKGTTKLSAPAGTSFDSPSEYFLNHVWPDILATNPNLNAPVGLLNKQKGDASLRVVQDVMFYRWLKAVDIGDEIQKQYAGKALGAPEQFNVELGRDKVVDGIAQFGKSNIGAEDAKKSVESTYVSGIFSRFKVHVAKDLSEWYKAFGADIDFSKHNPKTTLNAEDTLRKLIGVKATDANRGDIAKKINEFYTKIVVAQNDFSRSLADPGLDSRIGFLKAWNAKDQAFINGLLANIRAVYQEHIPTIIADAIVPSEPKHLALKNRTKKAVDNLVGKSRLWDPTSVNQTLSTKTIKSPVINIDEIDQLNENIGVLAGVAAELGLTDDDKKSLAKALSLPEDTFKLSKPGEVKNALDNLTHDPLKHTIVTHEYAQVMAYLNSNVGYSIEWIDQTSVFVKNKLFGRLKGETFTEAEFNHLFIESLADKEEREQRMSSFINAFKDMFFTSPYPVISDTQVNTTLTAWKTTLEDPVKSVEDKFKELITAISNLGSTSRAVLFSAYKPTSSFTRTTLEEKIREILGVTATAKLGNIDPNKLAYFNKAYTKLKDLEDPALTPTQRTDILKDFIGATLDAVERDPAQEGFLKLAQPFATSAEIDTALAEYLRLLPGATKPHHLLQQEEKITHISAYRKTTEVFAGDPSVTPPIAKATISDIAGWTSTPTTRPVNFLKPQALQTIENLDAKLISLKRALNRIKTLQNISENPNVLNRTAWSRAETNLIAVIKQIETTLIPYLQKI